MNSKKNIFSISVVIIDDHELVLMGTKALLADSPNIKIIGTANDGKEGAKLVNTLKPDVVIMDVYMPEMSGIKTTRDIVKRNKKVKVIMLSSIDRIEIIERAKKAGAKGYVIKSLAAKEIIDAIEHVYRGSSSFIYRGYHILCPTKFSEINTSLYSQLSDKEHQVLELILRGYKIEEMAKILKINERSVRVRRYSLQLKLGVDADVDLMKMAVQSGIYHDA